MPVSLAVWLTKLHEYGGRVAPERLDVSFFRDVITVQAIATGYVKQVQVKVRVGNGTGGK